MRVNGQEHDHDIADWPAATEALYNAFPVANTFHIGEDGRHPDRLPSVLAFAAATAASAEANNVPWMAIAVPQIGAAGLWVALAATLTRMDRELPAALERLPDIAIGSKVVLDGRSVAQLTHRDDEGRYRLAFHPNRNQNAGNLHNAVIIGAADRLRLQPALGTAALDYIHGHRHDTTSALDNVLGHPTQRNRSLFSTQVLLVTRVAAAGERLREALLSGWPGNAGQDPEHPNDVLQWGVVEHDGDINIESPGRFGARPALLLAADLIRARDYVRDHQADPPLVIIDGAPLLRNRMAVLQDFQLWGTPLVAIVAQHEREALSELAGAGFRMWQWSRYDVHEALAADALRAGAGIQHGPFALMRRSLGRYARRDMTAISCARPELGNAYIRLRDFDGAAHAIGHDDASSLVGSMYGCLLIAARRVSPQEDGGPAAARLLDRIGRLEAAVEQARIYLTADARESATGFVNHLRGALVPMNDGADSKAAKLLCVLRRDPGLTTTVVVDSCEAVEPTRAHIRRAMPNASVEVVALAGLSGPSDCQHLVLPGWLGTDRMRRIVGNASADRITVLAYPFERNWYDSVIGRWDDPLPGAMTWPEKAAALGIELPLVEVPPVEAAPAPREGLENIEAFELKLDNHRRNLRAAAAHSDGAQAVPACYVQMAEGYYAHVSLSRRLPVVIDAERGVAAQGREMPRKRPAELVPGDFVVFREGANSDVLRSLADAGLAGQNQRDARLLSGRWRDSLRKWLEGQRWCADGPVPPDVLRNLAARLRDHGLDRSIQTIRNWITDDLIIGPEAEELAVPAIARAVGDADLLRRSTAVCAAITLVRGAHLQASAHLREVLLAALPDLADGMGALQPVFSVDLGDVGRAMVVQVEGVDAEEVQVPPALANMLRRDDD